MSDKNYKLIRKQLRNVVNEILPDLLKTDLVAASHKDVTAKVEARLDSIVKHLEGVTTKIDDRNKEIQSYLLRNTTHMPAPPTAPETPSES